MPATWIDHTSHTIPKRRELHEHQSDESFLGDSWYKFMAPQYAEDLCVKGRFRLGHLFLYRQTENMAAGVQDLSDGEFPYDVFVAYAWNCDDATGEIRDIWRNCRFLGSEHIADAYVFSVSKSSDDTVKNEFADYPAIVEIHDPATLLDVATKILHERELVVGSPVINECRYFNFPIGEPLFLDGGAHPGFVKHATFCRQAEIRTLWQPTKPPEPIFIESPEIAKCCQIVQD